jgi:hypothetical protein
MYNRPVIAKGQIGRIIRSAPQLSAIRYILNHTQDFCRVKQQLVASYVDMSVTKVAPFPGLTTKLSCLSVQKWTHRHNSALLWGCMNALNVQSDPERALTHVFYVTLELTDEARAGTRLKVNRMFRVVDAVAIEKEQLARQWWEITPQLQGRPEKEEDVITTTIVRCGEYADFLDALHRKVDLRAGYKSDRTWKATFMAATKVSDREVDVVKTDPLQYDLD